MSEGRSSLTTCVIAMQKVVGSNPISRFFPPRQSAKRTKDLIENGSAAL